MKISVIIPVYNEKSTEKSTISEIIARVRAVDLEKEIIIVDDGSTDGTSQHLAEIGSQFEAVNLKT
jgi:glycosyltransferase involved in cell wall biosynthesis